MKSKLNVLITDTNIWIDLIKGGLLDAFFELPYSINASDLVRDYESIGISWRALAQKGLQFIELTPTEIGDLYRLHQSLPKPSIPDLASYLVAVKTIGILLTGDKALRVFAEQKIEVHGFLWVVDKLVNLHIITARDASNCLELMLQDPKTRLPKRECNKRINKWRK